MSAIGKVGKRYNLREQDLDPDIASAHNRGVTEQNLTFKMMTMGVHSFGMGIQGLEFLSPYKKFEWKLGKKYVIPKTERLGMCSYGFHSSAYLADAFVWMDSPSEDSFLVMAETHKTQSQDYVSVPHDYGHPWYEKENKIVSREMKLGAWAKLSAISWTNVNARIFLLALYLKESLFQSGGDKNAKFHINWNIEFGDPSQSTSIVVETTADIGMLNGLYKLPYSVVDKKFYFPVFNCDILDVIRRLMYVETERENTVACSILRKIIHNEICEAKIGVYPTIDILPIARMPLRIINGQPIQYSKSWIIEMLSQTKASGLQWLGNPKNTDCPGSTVDFAFKDQYIGQY